MNRRPLSWFSTACLWTATVWYGLSTLLWLLGGALFLTILLIAGWIAGHLTVRGGPLGYAGLVVFLAVIGGQPAWAGWCLRRAWRHHRARRVVPACAFAAGTLLAGSVSLVVSLWFVRGGLTS